jgi:hypothetical protein
MVAAALNSELQRQTEEENLATAAAKVVGPVSMKREDTEIRPAESVEPRETPVPQASNPAPKGRSSKTSTPVLSTFSELNSQRTRPTRNTEPAPAKRSHKKSGSVAVPQQRAVSEEEDSLHEGDDEDEDGEPRYCYCNEISFGEMVACDNDACPREWFHLSCVGLTKPPGKNGKIDQVPKLLKHADDIQSNGIAMNARRICEEAATGGRLYVVQLCGRKAVGYGHSIIDLIILRSFVIVS